MIYSISEITNHQHEVTALCIDGEYWSVDYLNIVEDTEDGRANFMCFNREEVYLIDNTKLEFKRFYFDELCNNDSVVLLKEVAI